jgi:hypothetical protein
MFKIDNKIPKKLNICGFEFNINEVDVFENIIESNEEEQLKVELDDDTLGQMSIDKMLIELKKDMPSDMKTSTFFHEIIEAWNSIFQLKLDHSQIHALENCLYRLFKDNK